MIVSQLMNTSVHACRPGDSLHEAAERMWNADVGCLPVLDDAGHVTGMVTDRDVCMAAYTQGKPLRAITVDSVMARDVASCLPNDTLEQAEYMMRSRRVRRLPVVNERGRLVGLISLNDLAREAARELPRITSGVSSGGLISTLAAICEPRHPELIGRAAQ